MKSKIRSVLIFLYTVFGCAAIFVSVSYLYLDRNLKPVEGSTGQVPYTDTSPIDCGLLFLFPSGNSVYFYLNFSVDTVSVIIPQGDTPEKAVELYGYPVNYKVKANNALFTEFVDSIDGISLTSDGEELRYTGVQLAEMFSVTAEPEELLREVTSAVIKKLADTGCSRSELVLIIENSETNLTVPDCFYWSEHLQSMFRNGRIVN